MDKGQTCSQPELGRESAKLSQRLSSDADSERKPDVAADSVFKAALEQKAAAEAQQLEEEVAETVAQEVFERVKAPQDPSVLRKAALGSRESLCGSATRAEPSETSPDCQQEMGLVCKELQGQEFPRASEQQSLEASKGAKLPVSPPLPNTTAAEVSRLSCTIARESIQNATSRVHQRCAERTGNARTVVPDVLEMAVKKLESEIKSNPRASAKALAIRAMAREIVDTVLERTCQRGPALTPELKSGRGVTKRPTPQDGKESHPAADALPSTGLQFSRQPVHPAGPKPPAQTGARRPLLCIKLLHSQPRQPV